MTIRYTHYDVYDFANRRHIGPSPAEMTEMLETLGVASLDELIDDTVPASIRREHRLDWGPALTERETIETLRELADRNQVLTSLIGQGYHGAITPAVIQRNILENPAWYTAYTPYQPEVSQGRLEALLNFQTMVCDLTGLDIANASLLDEATAAAEAMSVAHAVSKSKATGFFVDAHCHPQTIAVLRTRAAPLGWSVIVGDPRTDLDPEQVFGALFQYPAPSATFTTSSHRSKHSTPRARLPRWPRIRLPWHCSNRRGKWARISPSAPPSASASPWVSVAPTRPTIATRDSLQALHPRTSLSAVSDRRGVATRPLIAWRMQTREQHIRREKGHVQYLYRPGAAERSWPRSTPCTMARTGSQRVSRSRIHRLTTIRLAQAAWPRLGFKAEKH